MKVFRKLNFAVISTLAIFLIYCQEPEVEREDIKTEIDRISYGLGNDFGANIRGQSDSVDIEIVLNGLNTRLNRGILETEFEDKMTEELYGIGASFGQMIINENVAVEKRILSKGVRDGYNNGEKLLSPLELTEAKELFQQKFIVLSDEAKNNGKEGAKFLMENAKNEDVFVLPSGMQYKILKEGSGQIPVVTDAVKLHYTGRYVDGTEFESTYTDNNPH
ncbi:MAG: hypothetical protein K9G34_09565, partial [Melioribacteraceae bacterium]|nr:hypothetical protein [Melioribacteraceae bacterium]